MTTSGLFAATTGQGIALMDTRRGRGRWHFLDPAGAQLWLKITSGGTGTADAIDALTAQWQARGAAPQQVRTDLTALAACLQAADLLHPAHEPRRDDLPVRLAVSAPIGARQQIAGWAGLLAALTLLRCLPVRFAVTAARAAAHLPGRTARATDAEAAVAAVRRAARWWPGRAACLEESLAAYLAAALTGHHVTWTIGARFTPNGAHAWIEADGHIIGQDPTDRIWPYVPALKVEPSH